VSGSKKGIKLKGSIKYDGEDVSSRSHELLDQLAVFLNGHPEFKLVQINVHTDDQGSPGRRSQNRADAVKDYLVGKGVSSSRIVAKGHGDSSPVAINMTPQGRAQNNRTTISVKDYGK
jgi:OmpA-OmpF porin, OOP family